MITDPEDELDRLRSLLGRAAGNLAAAEQEIEAVAVLIAAADYWRSERARCMGGEGNLGPFTSACEALDAAIAELPAELRVDR